MSSQTAVSDASLDAPSPVRPGSILVGVDGSNDGLRAVDFAAAEAQLRKTTLHIVTALPPASATAFGLALPVLTDRTVVTAAERATAAAARRAQATGLAAEQITTAVVPGRPGNVLAELSKGATAVVLGRRGLSGLERVFAGSTSVAVGAGAHCPVMVVPHGWRPPVAGGRAIGVGIDGSAESVPALAAAYAEATTRQVELRVIFAYQPEPDPADPADYEATLA